jgi:hypothetical protein
MCRIRSYYCFILNDNEAKFDIKDWDSEHAKIGKGVIVMVGEIKTLKDILNKMKP